MSSSSSPDSSSPQSPTGMQLLGFRAQRPHSLRQKFLNESEYTPRPHSTSNISTAAAGFNKNTDEQLGHESDVYRLDQYFNPDHRRMLTMSQDLLCTLTDDEESTIPLLDRKIRTYCIENLNALNKFNKHEIIAHNSRMGASFLKSAEGKILYYNNKSKYYSFWALFSWKHSILSKRQTWIHLALYLLFMVLASIIGISSGLAKSIQVVRVSEDVIIILVRGTIITSCCMF